MPDSAGSVIFLDSGVGGLPYLELSRSMLKGTTLHYFADDAGFPYGSKTSAQVRDLVLDRVRRLSARFSPKAIVIACNTASQAALAAVRAANPELPFVGTVPAVKPAAESSTTGVIGILATERAVADPYLDDLVARYAPGVEVVRRAAPDLVWFVERHYLDSTAQDRRNAVREHVTALLVRGVDRIVLACTHFLHVEADIAELAAELSRGRASVVDSRQGVANRLAEILQSQGAPAIPAAPRPARPGAEDFSGAEADGAPGGILLLSGDPPHPPAYSRWAAKYGLSGPVRL